MESKSYTITYLCPQCEKRINRNVQYLDPNLFTKPSKAKVTIGLWCNNCNAKHELTFSIKKLKDKKLRITTHYFKCGEIGYNKRLRLKTLTEESECQMMSTGSLFQAD